MGYCGYCRRQCIGHVEAKGSGFVAVAAAMAAHILSHFGVVKLHDGETGVAFHKLPGVACGSYIDSHCRALVAQIVAYSAPANGHGIAGCGVSAAKYQILGEPVETVLRKLLLNVEGCQFCCHGLFVFGLLRRGAAGHEPQHDYGRQDDGYLSFHNQDVK